MIYAVGDIHGECEKLEELLACLPLKEGDSLVFLGDYVDRGPDPRGVIETLIALRAKRRCTFLLGNHESMFLDYLGWTDPRHQGAELFLDNGGQRTLESYGLDARASRRGAGPRLPGDHEEFLLGLPLFYREDSYLFIHAGLGECRRTSSDLEASLLAARTDDLLWNRTLGDARHEFGMTVVYGHTSQEDFGVRWNLPYSVGIDTGAVYGGPLTALRLPDHEIFQV